MVFIPSVTTEAGILTVSYSVGDTKAFWLRKTVTFSNYYVISTEIRYEPECANPLENTLHQAIMDILVRNRGQTTILVFHNKIIPRINR